MAKRHGESYPCPLLQAHLEGAQHRVVHLGRGEACRRVEAVAALSHIYSGVDAKTFLDAPGEGAGGQSGGG